MEYFPNPAHILIFAYRSKSCHKYILLKEYLELLFQDRVYFFGVFLVKWHGKNPSQSLSSSCCQGSLVHVKPNKTNVQNEIQMAKCSEWNTDGTMFSLMEVKHSWPRNVPDLGDVASSSYLKEGRCNINNFP